MRLFSRKTEDDENVDLAQEAEWWSGDDQATPPPPPFDPEMATAVSPQPPPDDAGWFMPDLAPGVAPAFPQAAAPEPDLGLPPIDQIDLPPMPGGDGLGSLTRDALGLEQAPATGDPLADFDPFAPLSAAPAAAAPAAPAAPAPAPAPAVPAPAPAPPAAAPGHGPVGNRADVLLAQLGLGPGASWNDISTAHRHVVGRLAGQPDDHRLRGANEAFAALRLLAVA